ncbi:Ulp1 protease family protein [Colletotrichum scovillei]|nr:Ulp1 protease family protein [Colletotrichum scovillei]
MLKETTAEVKAPQGDSKHIKGPKGVQRGSAQTDSAHQTLTSRDTQPEARPRSPKAVTVANELKKTTKRAESQQGDSVNGEGSNGVQRGSAESSVHPKPQQVSLDTLLAGLHCLDDGRLLNDAVVNILIGTLACDSVAVIDSLQLTSPFKPSPSLQMRLLALRETNLIVMPCFHRQSKHWRLFIHLRGSDSIAELDSLNLPNQQGVNTVLPMVAQIRGPSGPTRVEKIRCARQGNNIDCGVFIVAFAMKIASATAFPPPGLQDQIDVPFLRQSYKKMLLTSTLASPPAALFAFHPLQRSQPEPHNGLLGSDSNVINFQRRLWDKCRHLRALRDFDNNRIASLQLQSELIQASAICCTAGLVDMHRWHATAIDEATRVATARRTLSVVTRMRGQMVDLLADCSGTENRYLSAQQQVALRMMGSAIGTAINEFPDHTGPSAQAQTQSLEWSLWTQCVVWWLTARRATNLCHKLQKEWHANHVQLADARRAEVEAMGIMHGNI